jgi:hypothetical protein
MTLYRRALAKSRKRLQKLRLMQRRNKLTAMAAFVTTTDLHMLETSGVRYMRRIGASVVDQVNIFIDDTRLPEPASVGLVLIGGLFAHDPVLRNRLGWKCHQPITSSAVESLLVRYPVCTVMLASVMGDMQPNIASDDALLVAGFTGDHDLPLSHCQYRVHRTDGTPRCEPKLVYITCFVRDLTDIVHLRGLISPTLSVQRALQHQKHVLFFGEGGCTWSSTIMRNIAQGLSVAMLPKPMAPPEHKRKLYCLACPTSPPVTFYELRDLCADELKRRDGWASVSAWEWAAELWRHGVVVEDSSSDSCSQFFRQL